MTVSHSFKQKRAIILGVKPGTCLLPPARRLSCGPWALTSAGEACFRVTRVGGSLGPLPLGSLVLTAPHGGCDGIRCCLVPRARGCRTTWVGRRLPHHPQTPLAEVGSLSPLGLRVQEAISLGGVGPWGRQGALRINARGGGLGEGGVLRVRWDGVSRHRSSESPEAWDVWQLL